MEYRKLIYSAKVSLLYFVRIVRLLLIRVLSNKSFGNQQLEVLHRFNKHIYKRRCSLHLVKSESEYVVVKQFNHDDDGQMSFNNEVFALEKLSHFPWFPKHKNIGNNCIEYHYIPNKYRLDQINMVLTNKEKEYILSEVLNILLTLFSIDIAHRDIQAKNIFFTGSQVYLIDFENLSRESFSHDFFESYDITGRHLTSPHLTNNMCLMSKSKASLLNKLNYSSIEDLNRVLVASLNKQLKENSISFHSNIKKNTNNRHYLRIQKIYSTFDLKYTKISRDHAQRDTKARLKVFNLDKQEIKDKQILGLGCHTGAIEFEILNYEPKFVLGLEIDSNKIHLANKLHALNCKESPLKFEKMDFESGEFYSDFNREFDVVMCLAVIGHLSDPQKFLNKIYNLTKSMLIIEGNANISVSSLDSMLKLSGFTNIEFLGLSNDEHENSPNNCRPIFKAYKLSSR